MTDQTDTEARLRDALEIVAAYLPCRAEDVPRDAVAVPRAAI